MLSEVCRNVSACLNVCEQKRNQAKSELGKSVVSFLLSLSLSGGSVSWLWCAKREREQFVTGDK